MKPLALGLLISALLAPIAWSSDTAIQSTTIVKMAPKQSEADASHAYLVEVLQLALNQTEGSYGPGKIELLPITFNQKLILSLLNHEGIIDIVGSAPTQEREIEFRSARVPLLMGLLGYRMMIIRAEDKQKFSAIDNEQQLQQLKSCQGTFWPDATIMEQNGYLVVRGDEFYQLFEMLEQGKCDYFPRGVTEGYAEIEAYHQVNPDKQLAVFDDILLYYQQPFMFYTSHANFELAARIEKGLIKAVTNGKLVDLMKQHPSTQHIFPLSQWQDRQIFKLSNPVLPKSLPLEHPEFWLHLTEKKSN